MVELIPTNITEQESNSTWLRVHDNSLTTCQGSQFIPINSRLILLLANYINKSRPAWDNLTSLLLMLFYVYGRRRWGFYEWNHHHQWPINHLVSGSLNAATIVSSGLPHHQLQTRLLLHTLWDAIFSTAYWMHSNIRYLIWTLRQIRAEEEPGDWLLRHVRKRRAAWCRRWYAN